MFTKRGVIVALAVLIGCSNAAVCEGEVGPEILHIDASVFAAQPEVLNIEVCVVPGGGDPDANSLCGETGSSEVSYTAHNDYPKVVDYYVVYQDGAGSHVVPADGGGTHRMSCEPTATHFILPSGQ